MPLYRLSQKLIRISASSSLFGAVNFWVAIRLRRAPPLILCCYLKMLCFLASWPILRSRYCLFCNVPVMHIVVDSFVHTQGVALILEHILRGFSRTQCAPAGVSFRSSLGMQRRKECLWGALADKALLKLLLHSWKIFLNKIKLDAFSHFVAALSIWAYLGNLLPRASSEQ
jgi:hypothetical protein